MFTYILDIIILTWLFVSSIYLFKLFKAYNRFFKSKDNKDLISTIESLIKDLDKTKLELSKLDKNFKDQLIKSQANLKYRYILRYNPFTPKGQENQSFVIVLLDETKTGVVLNFIYTGDQYRIYPKIVNPNNNKNLTPEEQQAIELAIKQNN
ncbi:MAG: hypothetical protein KatS3mg090_0214 [Patescibacteria group bacterium]|nr:MAG: hypothetical protein KatS3mg090_0214 [Patescibacteria group bacterium]